MLVISRKAAACSPPACAIAVPAAAELSAADIAKLGTTLTPAGRREGRQRRRHHPRVGRRHHQAGRRLQGRAATTSIRIPNDKPLFTITAQNADQYKDKLTAGAMAMLKKYPNYKMVVYPTRRSASAPEGPLQGDARSARRRRSSPPGGNGVVGCIGGMPFPIPKDGNEAIWNSLLRYRGDTFAMHWSQAAVTRTGDYALVKFEYEYDFSYGNLAKPVGAARDQQGPELPAEHHGARAPRGPDPAGARDRGPDQGAALGVDVQPGPAPRAPRARTSPTTTPAPPPTACAPTTTSACSTAPPTATTGSSWARRRCTSRTTRTSCRIRSSSTPTSSSPATSTRTSRATSCTASGSWRRRSSRAPATSTRSASSTSTRTAGRSLATDKYDGRGELWRYAELHNENWYNIPTIFGTIEVHNDLQSGRYIAMGLRSEEKLRSTSRSSARRATTRRRTCAASARADAAGSPARRSRGSPERNRPLSTREPNSMKSTCCRACGARARVRRAGPASPQVLPASGPLAQDHDAAPAAHGRGARRQPRRRRRRPRLHRLQRRQRRDRGAREDAGRAAAHRGRVRRREARLGRGPRLGDPRHRPTAARPGRSSSPRPPSSARCSTCSSSRPTTGFAVGAYGAFYETTDGGKTWNARKVIADDKHLNAILRAGRRQAPDPRRGGHDPRLGRLRARPGRPLASPYKGSFFGGVVADDGARRRLRLRGRIYRSTDGGKTLEAGRQPLGRHAHGRLEAARRRARDRRRRGHGARVARPRAILRAARHGHHAGPSRRRCWARPTRCCCSARRARATCRCPRRRARRPP